MPDPQEIELVLRQLSARQCQILYWIGQGLDYRQIGEKLGYSEKVIQAEMSRVYRVFGLTGETMQGKRWKLIYEILPVHARIVSNPETDCQKGISAIAPAEKPDPAVEVEVAEDARQGLIPIDRSLIRASQPPQQEKPSEPRGIMRQGKVEIVRSPSDPQPRPSSPLLLILVGVLGTLLLVSLIGLIYLLTREPSPSAQVAAPPPVVQTALVTVVQTTVATVVVPQTIIVERTVIATQLSPTAARAATPVPTPVNTVAPLPSLTSGPVDLAGKVPSEIPGIPLELRTTVTSVVDRNTKRSDVYALVLSAGQQVRFTVEPSVMCLGYYLYNPGTKSIESNQDSVAWWESCYGGILRRDFTSAISGTYYFEVRAGGSGQRYNLTVTSQP